VFDVLMMRFEVMEPRKAALRRIVRTAGPEPQIWRAILTSQRWMLEAAGLSPDGPRGALRTLGLASIYADAFRTWLKDDDAGLSTTMARLDRRLRRSERAIKNVRDLTTGVCNIVFARNRMRSGDAGAPEAHDGDTRDDGVPQNEDQGAADGHPA